MTHFSRRYWASWALAGPRELWHSLFGVAQTSNTASSALQQHVPKAWKQISIRLAPCHSAPPEPRFPRRVVSPSEALELCVPAEFAFQFPELGSRLVESSTNLKILSNLLLITAFLTDTTPKTVFTPEHRIRTSLGLHVFVFFTKMRVTLQSIKLKVVKKKKKAAAELELRVDFPLQQRLFLTSEIPALD